MRYIIFAANAFFALAAVLPAQEYFESSQPAAVVIEGQMGMPVPMAYESIAYESGAHEVYAMPTGVISNGRTGVPSEPSWNPTVVATGMDRESIRSMHILERPYRPLHVYGNTVRRMHYRGRVAPSSVDVRSGIRALMFGR